MCKYVYNIIYRFPCLTVITLRLIANYRIIQNNNAIAIHYSHVDYDCDRIDVNLFRKCLRFLIS